MNRMTITIVLVCIGVASAAALAQRAKAPAETKDSGADIKKTPAETKAPAHDAKKAPAETSPNGDEDQIRNGVVAFVKLYNAHKAEELTQLFALDARMVFRDGTEVNGHDEIKQSFEDAFASSPKAAVSVDVDSIRFLTPEVAVEEGVTSTFPDGDTLTSRGRYTVLHLKRDGRWMMQSVRVVEEESLSAYGELQPLEWLVGEWLDEGRDEIVESEFSWDDNKSFLLENFQIVREGSVVLKGSQRIGWDPQAKQIRSWTFDNAGGFGEAVWTPVGDDWVCKAKGVRSDGSSASATRILRRVTKDRVVWLATDRLEDNEQLPDLEVTMVHKPPKAK
jgi:uncharacterized protein (TIGR02246 family)